MVLAAVARVIPVVVELAQRATHLAHLHHKATMVGMGLLLHRSEEVVVEELQQQAEHNQALLLALEEMELHLVFLAHQ